MADETIVTNIVANANFSSLIANVHKVTAELSQLKSTLATTDKALAMEAAKIQQGFAATLRSTGQFSTHFVSLTSDVDKFGKNLDQGKLKLKDYFNTFQQHTKTSGGLIRELARQQVQLQNAILQPLGRNAEGLMQFNVQIPRGLDATKNKAALARQEMQIFNKVIQDGGVQLINWGKNTQWAGRQLTVGLTVPIAAFGKAAADAFKQADEQLVRLTKVYGGVAQTSAAELSKIRKEVAATARELSSQYGASYKETIALAADIAATGKEGNDLLKSTAETTRLSILGEVSRQDAMKATLAIQSGFKQNTEQLAESINFLNAVENQTSTSLQDLIEAIPKAGPVVKSLGGSIQDLALYLTAMKEGGINASEGANAIKSSLASLINPTKVAKEMFAGFGIDLGKIVTNNAGDLTATILDLQSALDTLDPLSKSKAIEQLFGKFQFARMSALFENLGKQGSQTLKVLDLMKASSQDLANIAGRELSQVTESASGKYKRALESLKADLAGVGEQFLTIGTFLIKIIDKIVQFSNKLPDPIKKLMAFAAGFTAMTGPIIMLTGVLANFLGYVVKGAAHFRAMFKGGEGWKLLTPEILAAQKAGNLLETTFYSDAKAASILSSALHNLNEELRMLQLKANSGVSAAPTISTVAGTIGMTGVAQREVDPTSQFISAKDTRAYSHPNPVSRMTQAEKDAQTIFGIVPGATKVNQKISNNPQMYMSSDLPKVSGVSAVKGVSTGIVAAEAAKWHAMTGALAMQSEQEINLLKREVSATGLITTSLSESYHALLPEMSKLTTLAATESAQIVADLQNSKITVDQARARVVALNARIEAMMGAAATEVATAQGRNINLKQLPIVNQPAFDPTSGKANMKELTRPGRTKELFNSIAKVLGVKTYGASYSIETTRPKRFSGGGDIEGFGAHKTIVSGPSSIGYDDRMGSVPLGGYVLNQGASLDPANADLVAAAPSTYSSGGPTIPALLTPKETVFGPGIQRDPALYAAVEAANNGYRLGGRIKRPKFAYGPPAYRLSTSQDEIDDLYNYLDHITDPALESRNRGNAILNDAIALSQHAGMPIEKSVDYATKAYDAAWKASKGDMSKFEEIRANMLKRMSPMIHTGKMRQVSASPKLRQSVADYMKEIGFKGKLYPHADRAHLTPIAGQDIQARGYFGQAIHDPYNQFTARLNRSIPGIPDRHPLTSADAHVRAELIAKELGFANYEDMLIRRSEVTHAARTGSVTRGSVVPLGFMKFARGVAGVAAAALTRGKVRTVNQGGMLPAYAMGGRIQAFTKSMIMKKLGATWGKNDDNPGWSHKSAQIGMGSKLFGKTGLRPNTQNLMYDALLETVSATMPNGYFKTPDGKLLRGIEPNQVDQMVRDAAEIVSRRYRKQLSPIDIKILKEQFTNWDLKSLKATPDVRGRIFNANKGGQIPGGKIHRRKNYYGELPSIGSGRTLAGDMGLDYSSNQVPVRGGMRSMVLGQGLGMAGMMAGSAVGGKFGGSTGSFAGSVIGGMLPSLLMSGSGVGKLAGEGGKLASVLGRVGLTATKANLALGAITTTAYLGYKMWQKHQEQLRLNTVSYGLTAEAASKAGLKYTDYNEKIKGVVESLQAMREKNELVYESMALADTPIKMTIEEYKKLKKEVKSTYQDQIKYINSNKEGDLADFATRLKEQLIAAGDSADTATKKIYAMFKLSNKSALSLSATLGNQSFNRITDAQTAAIGAVSTYGKSVSSGASGADKAAALNTALTAIDTGISEIVAKSTKAAKADKTGKTEIISLQDAEKQQLDRINNSKMAGVKITKATIDEMAKANPLIRQFATEQDTVISLWQKTRLQAQGYLGDLSKLNSAQTNALYQMSTVIAKTTVDTNKSGALAGQYAKLKNLTDAQAKYMAAAKGQSAQSQINSRKQIDALNKEIDAINKAAEARKKALEEQQAAEDVITAIKKKQIEYQDALANGDMSGAAQAQLDLKQITSQRQKDLTLAAIDKATAAQIAPLQAKKDALEAANQKAADAASLAGEKLTNLSSAIEKQKQIIDDVNTSMSSFNLNLEAYLKANPGKTKEDYINTAEGRGVASSVAQAANAAGINNAPTYSAPPQIVGQLPKKSTPQEQGLYIVDKTFSAVEKALIEKGLIVKGDVYVNGEKVDMKPVKKPTPIKPAGYNGIPIPVYTGTSGLKRAGGGSIYGPGTSTSDSIPIMASNGEYMFSAKAVMNMGGSTKLDALHEAAKRGPLSMKASGGLVGARYDIPSQSLSVANSTLPGYNKGGSIHHYNAGGIIVNAAPGQDPREIAKHVVNLMDSRGQRRDRMNGGSLVV